MSSNANTAATSSTVPNRQVAKRVLAAELHDATETFSESDDERAPNFTVLPTGERANRVFFVGTLTDTEDVSNDGNGGRFRGKISGPTGTFYVYAGQYQPDAATALRSIEPPEFVAITAKFNQFINNETDKTMVGLTPESVTVVDEDTQQRWVAEAARLTRERVESFDEESADSDRARDAYGDDLSEYEAAVDDAFDALSTDDNENASE